MKRWATSVMLWLLLASTPSQAQELCAPEIMLRRAAVTHEGLPGIWFHQEVARCMLNDLRTATALRESVRLLEHGLELRDAQIHDLTAARDLAEAQLPDLQATVVANQARISELEDSLTAWHRNPFVITIIGIAVGAISVLLPLILAN